MIARQIIGALAALLLVSLLGAGLAHWRDNQRAGRIEAVMREVGAIAELRGMAGPVETDRGTCALLTGEEKTSSWVNRNFAPRAVERAEAARRRWHFVHATTAWRCDATQHNRLFILSLLPIVNH